jgi:alpha-glucosidase (family GH31 glycosyl hydrolase)
MKHSILAFILGVASLAVNAGNTNPTIEATGISGNRTVTVTALTPNIIKVTNSALGEHLSPSRLLLTPGNDVADTLAVVINGANNMHQLITSTGVSVNVNGTTGEVIINSGNSRGLYDNGQRLRDAAGRRTLSLLPLESHPTYYGGGERGYSLNLAGDTLVMYNRQNYGYTDGDLRIKQMNITMPLLVSPSGYALVIDDYAAAEMLTSTPLTYASESAEPLTYYYVNASEGFYTLSTELSQLIGTQPLPPFWSLGYITSKYGYKTAKETTSVIADLKKAGYPVDGIVLDLYWYGQEEDMGRLDWEKSQWGNHKAMLKKLKKQGVNLIAISQPYVLRNGKGLSNYNLLSAQGMFGKDSIGGTKDVTIWVGEGGMLDVSNPDTRQWLGNRYKKLTDEGVSGWWGDLGEPEKHPEGMIHANGLPARQYHNLYGNDWSSIIYNLFRDNYPNTRLMTMMRGGTIGLQRYSVFPWSTDVSRSWKGLQAQIKIMLNSGMSGLGYMSHDVGGFAIDKEHPVDAELYVRWLQLGLFSPILRTHSQSDAEPHLYTDLQDVILPLVKARYEWLPYNYTLAYENAAEGLPLVRQIGMYAEDPSRYADVDDQYLWGHDVMIAPVMQQGATSRSVRFPDGVWIDYNNPSTVIKGDTTLTVDAPLSKLPMYVRAGALIPQASYAMANTLDYNPANYTIHYYPVDANAVVCCNLCAEAYNHSHYRLFEDDRTSTNSIANGEYARIDFSAHTTRRGFRITAAVDGSYTGMPTSRNLTFVVHTTKNPRAVTSNAGDVSHTFDTENGTLTITVSNWNTAKHLLLDIGEPDTHVGRR